MGKMFDQSTKTQNAGHVLAAWERHIQRASAEGFLALLSHQGLDLCSADAFPVVIRTAIENFNIRPTDLASYLGHNASSVSRWASGASLPHPSVRPIVIGWLGEQINSQVLAPLNYWDPNSDEEAVTGYLTSGIQHVA